MSYCDYCRTLPPENLHRIYHDFHYGFSIDSDVELFERLVLEINQAGLSWDLMLKKQQNFKSAFHNYDIEKVAAFSETDINRLMQDAGIVRNALKIRAVIYNAQKIFELQATFGSFKKWLESHHPQEKESWVKIFKKTFKFVGGEIVNEFLMSTGYLPGSHDSDCPIFAKLSKL
jgi:DNA-3-methyladenine glycosylase I